MSQAGVANNGNIPPPPGSVTDLQGQDGITVPPNGSGIIFVRGTVVAAGTTPFTTSGNAGTSTETWSIQLSQAAGVSASNIVGLSAFNSAQFTVDANGFVSLAGGGLAVDSFAMQTGTSPVVPTGAGLVTFNGAVVPNGTNPVRTDGTGANTMTLEVQTSAAIAATDATKIGLSAFNSTQFTVDANGFVSLTGAGFGQTITGDSGGPLAPVAGNWNILGGPGVTTSGSGNTLTINSVVFTDLGISTSVTSDSGTYATGANTFTTPATPLQGEELIFVSTTAGAIVVKPAGTHKIRIGALITSAGGSATSTSIGDTITLRYRAADTTWYCVSVIGVWTIA